MTNPINLYIISRMREEASFNRVERHASGKGASSKTKVHEIESLKRLTDKLVCEHGLEATELDGFFLGYNIPQIGKEFDLLKFNERKCLNIEYKSQAVPMEQVRRQLLKNRHYLAHLGKQTAHYTVITSDFTCYHLDGSGEPVEVPFFEIAGAIRDMSGDYLSNIDSMFRISNFLVSPLNTPDKFIRGEYFLTQAQDTVKATVIKKISEGETKFYAITGKPGTGKTLLLYDIAKNLALHSPVLIIHCGRLLEGQRRLNASIENLTIAEVRSVECGEALDDFRYILIDEAQRIHKEQLDCICKHIENGKQTGIFSFDPDQVLSKAEESGNIADRIFSLEGISEHRLSEKVRTNKELSSFIDYVLNLNKKPTEKMDYPNVSLSYANTVEEAKNILEYMRKKGYVFINFSKGNTDLCPYFGYGEDFDAHHVIGQEYDKIMLLLDGSFYYDEEGKLRGKTQPNTDYLYEKLLYQGITRVREKLSLVIVENESLFVDISKIFDYWDCIKV
ncbi:MAG: DUF2075 domain-containing protein [Clostridia bacterium]|nr:DUF2075 domain-containing protein [Clostridia bacterium]